MSVTYLPLTAWNKRWTLDGQVVRCQGCRVSQDLLDPAAFRHALGCPAWGRPAQYPGREFMAILQQKIHAGLF